MSFSLNRITLIGNLGKDAETRFTTNNLAVTSFTLATTYGYKGKDGNWVNETTWHNVVSFNLSDFVKDSLKKGKKFYVEGRLSKREYVDKDGVKKYFTEVVTDKVFPLEGREGGSDSYSDYSRDASSQSPQVSEASGIPSADENDDLPF